MRFESKDIIFDDEIDVNEAENGLCINGYIWATDKMCELANYNQELGTDAYLDLYQEYNINKDEWRLVISANEWNEEKEKYKYRCESMNLTQNEKNYLSNKMIEYYFETKENWNDFIKNIKGEYK